MQSRKRLLQLLNHREFLTGTVLGKELGISRAAVHKHISSLQDSGLPIDSVPGRGYRLAKGIVVLNGHAITQYLDDQTRSQLGNIYIEQNVDSTNNYLWRLSKQNSIHGVVCIAESQSTGRGRRGSDWIASPYRNLLMSLGWVYDSWPQGVSGMAIAVGIGLIDALTGLGINKLRLKWPNDIVYGNNKLGGILIDVSGESIGPCSLVIGIGINVQISERDGQLIEQPWTDLVNGLQCDIDRNLLAAACITRLHRLLSRYVVDGFEFYRKRWRDVDVLRGRKVVVANHDSGERVVGTAVDLDHTGALRLRQQGGKEIICYHGDVSVKRQ